MEIFEFDYHQTPSISEPIIICLGYFDGVHLGHQALFHAASNEGYKVAVLTFDNSPAFVLGKIHENHYLTSNADKAEFLSDLGIDYFLLMHFDEDVAKITKDEFIEHVLKKFNIKRIYCGEDYRFGLRAEGTPEYLQNYYDVDIFALQKVNNKKIASRTISELIMDGKVDKVPELLGRPYRINGIVVEGNKNGRRLDFPTANLKLDYPYLFPKIGVYMGYADVYGTKYKAIVNVGNHPTIMPLAKPIIEVHLIDFDGILYGKDIFVEFVSYMREQIKFASADDLKNQLEKDKALAKKSLKL